MSRVAWTQLRPAEDAEAVREAIDRVLDRGWFVLGPEGEAAHHLRVYGMRRAGAQVEGPLPGVRQLVHPGGGAIRTPWALPRAPTP